MSDSLVNIRVYYWHFKLNRKFIPRIEKNNYWVHYYRSKLRKRKEPFVEVYQFFT